MKIDYHKTFDKLNVLEAMLARVPGWNIKPKLRSADDSVMVWMNLCDPSRDSKVDWKLVMNQCNQYYKEFFPQLGIRDVEEFRKAFYDAINQK